MTENDNQAILEAGRDTTITEDEYVRNAKALRSKSAGNFLELLEKYDVDVIAGPCDSRFASVGSAAGLPVGNLPLGFAHFNGRPFSLHVLAPKDEDLRILRVMSAWEATFPENVRPPPLLAPK